MRLSPGLPCSRSVINTLRFAKVIFVSWWGQLPGLSPLFPPSRHLYPVGFVVPEVCSTEAMEAVSSPSHPPTPAVHLGSWNSVLLQCREAAQHLRWRLCL